jgi:hypothetical protein
MSKRTSLIDSCINHNSCFTANFRILINSAMPMEAITPAPYKQLTFARLLRQT